ncbi:uncharacterized protein LOC122033566 isoform X2 [Zingiber officinale]|uniref:uncharacterized protein LOC122033566 isoform X2 n=1 Tax=Zingiber officinale TaxID=94328 RepID=UPI001C4AD819|nr:uncharacterized protein LOC122033566 isoform X2 [Zingiber officinale]
MGSNLEGGPFDNNASQEEEDTFAFVADSVVKSGEYHMPKKAVRTLSHSLSSDSGQDSSTENAEIKQTIIASVMHDSFVENAEHKQAIKASVVHDASENVVLNPEAILDAVEDSSFLQEQTNPAGCCLFSLDASKTSDLLDRRTCSIADEQHRRNCNMGNNSCNSGGQDSNNANHGHPEELKKKVMGCHFGLTDNSHIKNDEENIHKEAIDDCNNSGPEEGETNCKGNTTILMKSSTTYCSKDANSCHNTDGIKDPISSSNMSSKFQFSCSGSQNKDLSQCAMDDGNSPIMVKLFFANDDGKKDISDGKVSNEDSVKSQPQLVSSEGIDKCLGTENGGNGFKPQEEVKSRGCNEQSDTSKSKRQMSQGLLQPDVEGEDSEETEEDVKVCDICGDEGQEELLAICSRCSDGAEHIYCMRIMLAKVPEGEWLCEECQLKETADKVTGKSKAQISRIESPPPEESNQNNEFSMENKAIDPDIRRDNEELANLLPSKRKRETMKVDSVFKEKVNEADGASTGTNIPSKPSQLSHENCKKAASDILKLFPTTCEKLEGISHRDSDAQSFNPESSKIQTPYEQMHGTLSKSISFNNSKVPKVKQLLNNVPWKQNFAKESNLTNKRSKGPSRGITKSASFRTESCVRTLSKTHALSTSHPENSRGVKQVECGTMLGTRNSDYQFASQAVSAKSNLKIQSCDAELKRISDSRNLAGSKGSNDATGIANEGKKQPSANPSRTSGGTSVVRFYKNEEQRPFLPPPKFAMLRHRDDKTKDQTYINSKLAASIPNRCHKCNETGHPTQFCPVDKLRTTAMTPPSDQSLRAMDNRTIRQKNAFEISSWKLGTKRKSPEQFEEVLLGLADVNSEETTKTFAAVPRNMPSVESTMDVQDHKKSGVVPRSETDLDIVNDLAAMPVIQNMSDQASIEIGLMRASVIPEINYIWQGAFEVSTSTRSLTVLDGFQAHLSSYVSPIALEVAGQLPCKVQLEEVPRLSSWPLQFCENNPKEDNIALFFFAKNIDSYENYYWKLMDNILKNDLALIGVVGAVELLIFPSNLLPENSQRWNNLFYLWGLFRGRQENSLGDLSGLNERSPVNSLNMKSARKDLSMQTGTEVCSAVEISDDTSPKVTRSDKLLKENSSKYSSCIDLQAIPISGNENEEQPLVEDIVHKNVPDDEEQTKQILWSHPAACSFRNRSHDTSVCVLRPESKFQIDIEQMASEMEKDIHSSVNRIKKSSLNLRSILDTNKLTRPFVKKEQKGLMLFDTSKKGSKKRKSKA